MVQHLFRRHLGLTDHLQLALSQNVVKLLPVALQPGSRLHPLIREGQLLLLAGAVQRQRAHPPPDLIPERMGLEPHKRCVPEARRLCPGLRFVHRQHRELDLRVPLVLFQQVLGQGLHGAAQRGRHRQLAHQHHADMITRHQCSPHSFRYSCVPPRSPASRRHRPKRFGA